MNGREGTVTMKKIKHLDLKLAGFSVGLSAVGLCLTIYNAVVKKKGDTPKGSILKSLVLLTATVNDLLYAIREAEDEDEDEEETLEDAQ